jgi:lysophospholipase L1-like esterase
LTLVAVEIAVRASYFLSDAGAARPAEMANLPHGQEFNMSNMITKSAYPDVVYELKPNLNGTFRGKVMCTNPDGLRDKAHPKEKPGNVFRIVGLGDSVAFGWGVNDGECYLDVLEQRLNDAAGDARRFEVINFGVPGYNTTMEVATFKHRARDYSPDLIIIHFVTNDLGVPMFMQMPDRGLRLDESYLWRLVRARCANRFGDELEANLVPFRMEDSPEDEKKRTYRRYQHMVGAEGYHRAMDLLAEQAGELNIPVLVMLGSKAKRHAEQVLQSVEKHGFHLVLILPYSDRFLADHLIDLDDTEAKRDLLWAAPGDSHPSAPAHTVYVEALMDTLAQMGIIKPQPSALVRIGDGP